MYQTLEGVPWKILVRPEVGQKWDAPHSKEIIFTITGLSHFPFFTNSPPFYVLSVGMKLKGHEPGFCVFPLNVYILV